MPAHFFGQRFGGEYLIRRVIVLVIEGENQRTAGTFRAETFALGVRCRVKLNLDCLIHFAAPVRAANAARFCSFVFVDRRMLIMRRTRL
jgi:hypothetical protein